MFACVVLLSQFSIRDVFYVKCLRVLSCYLSSVLEMCYMLNKCLRVLSCYLSSVLEMCYMLNVCVCCLVISVQY